MQDSSNEACLLRQVERQELEAKKFGFYGEYIYFIGEEVSELNTVPEGFQQIVVPKQQYATPAPMPDVIVNAWKEIWEMSLKQLGGHRSYETDFEVYDERAADHQNIVLDLYIGIQS